MRIFVKFFVFFQCVYEADSTYKNGVTHIKLTGDKVVAGRLGGQVDILRLETYARGVPIDYNFSSAYRRSKFFFLFFLIYWR